jgi:hypothetical protein
MSEYQRYEFRSVDRPLTSSEMGKLRAISSRARITSTSFINTYTYGDLRGDPEALIGKYFDAFVYVANWGTHWFMLRMPKKSLGRRECAPYCTGDFLRTWIKEEHVLLSFRAEELEVDWEEDEDDWMGSLLSLRADLLSGDLRALYLGWLLAVQREEIDDDAPEPPIPAGLRNPSAPLSSLVDFLDIDIDLVESAAEGSADLEIASPHQDQLAQWIAGLPESEKDTLLLQVAAGDASAGAGLLRRFRSSLPAKPASPQRAPRTAGQLRTAAAIRSQEKAHREEERRRVEQEREAQRKAAERTKHLDALEKREEAAWTGLDNLIGTKRPNDYDRAVVLLVDLRDVALRGGRGESFQSNVRGIIKRHANKSSFLGRLKEAKLEGG